MKKIIPYIKQGLCALLFILTNLYCIQLIYNIYNAYNCIPSGGVFDCFYEYHSIRPTFERFYIRIILSAIFIYATGLLGLLWSFEKVRLKWFILSILTLILFIFCSKIVVNII